MRRETSHHPQFRIRPLCAALLFAFTAQHAQANPAGGVVASGNASFAASGNTLTVTNTPGTIINWKSFSIDAKETTHFAQQSAASTVLNRVAPGNPSDILGTLSSNGRVFLVNPGGVIFGKGATIDVAGLVATTLNLSDADFQAGRHRFTNPSPTGGGAGVGVVNAGNLTAQSGGQIYLIAPNIENTGVITAPNGEILLAAGHSVELVDTSSPNLRVNITAPAGDATNVGKLVAESGSLGLFGTVVRNSGTVSASSAVMQGGKIVFKASQDTYIDKDAQVLATGTTGGSIEVLGNRVAVMDNAQLDVSGQNGGGSVLIGGDYQGKNPEIRNASITYFGSNASIRADALENGDGGKVVVWADDITRAYGNISARGGTTGGNGGFVEVSGKNYLDFQGRVDTNAPKGLAGNLLLDPADIIIDNSTNVWNGTFSGGVFSNSSAAPSYITWATINAQTGGITIQTSPGTGGAGDISINASGTVTGPSSLTLLANNNINFANSVVVNGGTADFNLIAGWNNSGWAVTSGTGNITFGTSSSLSTSGNVYLSAGNSISQTVSSSITANTLSITGDASGGAKLPGGVSLPGTNMVNTLAADLATTGGGFLAFSNGQSLVIGTGLYAAGIAASGNTSPINITTTAGNLTVSQPVVTTGGNVTLASASNISLSSGSTITSGAGAVTLNSDSDSSGAGNIQMNTGSSVTTSGGNIILGGGANPLTTAAAGSGTATSAVASGIYLDGATLDAGGGNISMRGTGAAGTSFGADGIYITGTSNILTSHIQTSGAGTITLNGTGGSGTSSNSGVRLGTYASISSVNGAISFTGQGAGSGANNYGLYIHDGATITATGTGAITLDGTASAGATSTSNHGVRISASGGPTKIESASGAIFITGVGKNDGDGLQVVSGAKVQSGTGAITLHGTGGNGGSANDGVYVTGAGTLVTSGGSIAITGDHLNTVGTSNRGVAVTSSAQVVATGAATITMTGQGGYDGDGLDVHGGALVQSGTGLITLNGTSGDGTGSNSDWGVVLYGAGTLVTSGGGMTITGVSTSTNSADSNHGIIANQGVKLTTTAGLMTLTGTKGAGATSDAVLLSGTPAGGVVNAAAGLTIAGTGDVVVDTGSILNVGTGNANISATNNILFSAGSSLAPSAGAVNISLASDSDGAGGGGISLYTSSLVSNGGNIIMGGGANPLLITAAGGNIRIDGSTLSSGSGNTSLTGCNLSTGCGVLIVGSQVQTTSGNITLRGTAGNLLSAATGVSVRSNSSVTTTGGNIAITGFGGNLDYGASILTGSQVSTQGTGSITIVGTGGTSSVVGDPNRGVRMNLGSSISTVNGAIFITGIGGGDGTGASNEGVSIDASTIQSTGTGAITLNGTGGNGTGSDYGLWLSGGTAVTSGGGMTLIGTSTSTAGNNNHGIVIDTGAKATTTGGLMSLTGTKGAGTTSDAVLLSGTPTGGVVNAAAGLLILGLGDVVVDANAAVNAAGYTDIQANNNILISAGSSLTSSSGALNINLYSDFDGAGGGGIYLGTGSSINSNGGNITLGGMPSVGYAIGNGTVTGGITFNSGIYVLGNITAGAGDVTMRGEGSTTPYILGDGIMFAGGTLSSNGVVTIDGVAHTWRADAGCTPNCNYVAGVHFANAGTRLSTATGTVSISGTNSYTGAGVRAQGITIENATIETIGTGTLTLNGSFTGTGAPNTNYGIGLVGGTVQTTAAGGGSIVLNGASSIDGGLVLSGSGSVLSNGGEIRMTGTGGGGWDAIYIGGTLVGGNASGHILLRSTNAGRIAIAGPASVNSGPSTLTINTAGGLVTDLGSGTITAGRLRLLGTGTFSFSGANNDIGALSAGVTGNLTLNETSGYSIISDSSFDGTAFTSTGGVTATGNVTLSTGGLIYHGGGGTYTDISTGGTLNLTARGIGYSTSRVGMSAGGAVTLTTTGAGSQGDIYVDAGSALALNPITTAAATSQQIDLLQSAGGLTMPLTQTDNDNWMVNAPFGITFLPGSSLTASAATFTSNSGIAAQGNLTVHALTGSISNSGNINAVGTLELSGAGGITLSSGFIYANGITLNASGAASDIVIMNTDVTSTSGMTVNAGRDISVGPSGGKLIATAGTQTITAGRDMSVIQDNGSAYVESNGGLQTINVGRNLLVQVTNNSGLEAHIEGGAGQLINVGGNLTLNALDSDQTRINALGDQTITVGGNMLLNAAHDIAHVISIEGAQTVSVGGNLTLYGGGAYLSGSIGQTVRAGGNISLNGGLIEGNPDVGSSLDRMIVGGSIYFDDTVGGAARISSVSGTSIWLHYPNLTSGGYFVNGVPEVSNGTSGFFAGGYPAILDSNLHISYMPQTIINQPILDFIVSSTLPPADEKKPDSQVVADLTPPPPDPTGSPSSLPVCQ